MLRALVVLFVCMSEATHAGFKDPPYKPKAKPKAKTKQKMGAKQPKSATKVPPAAAATTIGGGLDVGGLPAGFMDQCPRSQMIGPGADVGNTVFEALPCKNGQADVDTITNMVDRGAIGVQYAVGPGPNAKHTLLHWACQHGNSAALVEALLARGADVAAREMRGRVPWALAQRSRGSEAARVGELIDAATPMELKTFSEARKHKSKSVPQKVAMKKPPKSAAKTGGGGGADAVAAFEAFEASRTTLDAAVAQMEAEGGGAGD